MKKTRGILGAFLIAAVTINVFFCIYQNKQLYFSHDYWQRWPQSRQAYLDSQYVNKHPKYWIVDQAAFSYAGSELIRGANPVLFIPDAPPLGKYLIGTSEILFNNENITNVLFGVASLVVLYFLSLQILKDHILALLPSFFYSFEPMYKNQYSNTPLFDIIQLVFILFYFYFFNRAKSSKQHTLLFFVIASLFLGFFISTKFFITGLPIVFASLFVLFIRLHKNKAATYIATLPISLCILLFSYIRVFAFHYTLNRFLGIQKWVFLYHKSQLILPFSVWSLLLFNRWYVWFGTKPVISDPQWFITWPIITIVSLLTMIFYLGNMINHSEAIEVLMVWSVSYLLFLSFGEIFSRYFIILLPVFYIIAIFGIRAFISRFFPVFSKKLLYENRN